MSRWGISHNPPTKREENLVRDLYSQYSRYRFWVPLFFIFLEKKIGHLF